MDNSSSHNDWGACALVAFIAGVAVWLILTPLVPAVSDATMRRFHLCSGSFASWAIQFPIPAMYNFANRYQAQTAPPELIDPIVGPEYQGYLNHFPTRIMTFADARLSWMSTGRDYWVTLRSDYRGRNLTTRFHLQRTGQQYKLLRLDSGGPPR